MSDIPITWVVWKFSFDITDETSLSIPSTHRILKVGSQNDQICIWVLVNPVSPARKVNFKVFGTGHPIPDEVVLRAQYLDTVVTHNNKLVWHVFVHYLKSEVSTG